MDTREALEIIISYVGRSEAWLEESVDHCNALDHLTTILEQRGVKHFDASLTEDDGLPELIDVIVFG